MSEHDLRIRHDINEFWDEDHIQWPLHLCTDEQFEIFRDMKQDMTQTLMVYKGIRLRDLKASYDNVTGNNLDNQLELVEMKDVSTLLVAMIEDIIYRIDMDTEEVYAYASDSALMKIGKTSHVQSLVYSTSDSKNLKPKKLEPIELKRVFMEGFMDVASGVPMQDPRIPIQDLGVAAEKIRLEAIKNKKMNKKKTYEEQVAIAKKKEKKQKMTAQVTAESTEPVEESKTGSINSFFDSIDPVPETVEKEETPTEFDNPSQRCVNSFYGEYGADIPLKEPVASVNRKGGMSQYTESFQTTVTVKPEPAEPPELCTKPSNTIDRPSSYDDFVDGTRRGSHGRSVIRCRDDDEISIISTTSTVASNVSCISSKLASKWGNRRSVAYRPKNTVTTATPTSSSSMTYPRQSDNVRRALPLPKIEDPEDEWN